MTYRGQKRRAQPDRTDDWLMTYADMITLLLCFFAIIIITTVPKRMAQPKVTPPVVSLLPQQIPPPLSPAQNLPMPPAAMDIFPGNLPFHSIEQSDPVEEITPESLPTKIEEAPPLVAATVVADDPKPQPSPSLEQKGDRITTLEMNSAAFFDSGSAVLSEGGAFLLRDVTTKLKSDEYKDYQITVEGHTDDTPIHTAQFPSNWELSTARASAVVHFFLEQGIPAPKLRAAGYADTFPKVPNRDANGNPIAANRAENRRVVMKLEKIEKE
jgi:outer membrane protein OmpA-like peptidoglycan-associated protein